MTRTATMLLATALTTAYNMSRKTKREAHVFMALTSENDTPHYFAVAMLKAHEVGHYHAREALGWKSKEARALDTVRFVATVTALPSDTPAVHTLPMGAC